MEMIYEPTQTAITYMQVVYGTRDRIFSCLAPGLMLGQQEWGRGSVKGKASSVMIMPTEMFIFSSVLVLKLMRDSSIYLKYIANPRLG